MFAFKRKCYKKALIQDFEIMADRQILSIALPAMDFVYFSKKNTFAKFADEPNFEKSLLMQQNLWKKCFLPNANLKEFLR
jgi:hypothetical protein